MAQGDLATLTNVKNWLSITDTGSDAVLSRLITAVSGQVRTMLSRDSLQSRVWTELRSPRPSGTVMLKHWPVVQVLQVLSDGAVVPQAVFSTSPAPQLVTDGWLLSPDDGPPGGHQTISWLSGWCRSQMVSGPPGIQITYRAGYQISNEAWMIPTGAAPTIQVQAPTGPWSGDVSVVDVASGRTLLPVTSTPSVSGTYQVLPAPTDGQPGVYLFAPMDAGRTILVSYSYVPSDLEQIVIDIIAERNAYRGRVGQRSKSLGGQETMSWDTSGMPQWASGALAPYTDVVPVYA